MRRASRGGPGRPDRSQLGVPRTSPQPRPHSPAPAWELCVHVGVARPPPTMASPSSPPVLLHFHTLWPDMLSRQWHLFGGLPQAARCPGVCGSPPPRNCSPPCPPPGHPEGHSFAGPPPLHADLRPAHLPSPYLCFQHLLPKSSGRKPLRALTPDHSGPCLLCLRGAGARGLPSYRSTHR